MKEFFRRLIDLLLPPRCIDCGEILSGKNGLCVKCFNKIRFISEPYCKICGAPLEAQYSSADVVCAKCMKEKRHIFAMMRSAFVYDENSKNLILALKFYDKVSNAPVLARFMFNAAKDIFKQNPDLIIPVPLHYMRLIKRKYNQSALLAAELSKLSGVKVDFSLKRSKNTIPQVKFSGKARVKNVRGAFCVKNNKAIKGKDIILIDDVLTTGSTLKECAIALKKAGARKVYAITTARTTK